MRHLADTYHLSKEAYLRKTPKNGKSRAEVLLIIEVGAAMVRGSYHGQGKRDHARGKR